MEALPPAQPPKPAPRLPPPPRPAGTYWPTVALGLVAAAAVAATIARQVGRRTAEGPADDPTVVFSRPAYTLSAPSSTSLKPGKPMAAPSEAPAAGGEQPDGSLGMVRGEAGMSIEGRTPDPFAQEGSLTQAVGLAPALSFSGQGGPAVLTKRVIRDPKAWRTLWKEIAHGKAPGVDFSRQILVAVFAGRQGTGTGVRIVSAAERGGKLRVVYALVQGRPAAKGKIWRPYHIVAVPATAAAAEFVRKDD